jgi:hypothetical protein
MLKPQYRPARRSEKKFCHPSGKNGCRYASPLSVSFKAGFGFSEDEGNELVLLGICVPSG